MRIAFAAITNAGTKQLPAMTAPPNSPSLIGLRGRADLARHIMRAPDDATVGRALKQLNLDGRVNQPTHRGSNWTATAVRSPDQIPDQMTISPDEALVSQVIPVGVTDLTIVEGDPNGGNQ